MAFKTYPFHVFDICRANTQDRDYNSTYMQLKDMFMNNIPSTSKDTDIKDAMCIIHLNATHSKITHSVWV